MADKNKNTRKKKADKRTIFVRVVALSVAGLMVASVFAVLLSIQY
ncbi:MULTISPECIES: hypothetical protein [unclassified Ruminococcus]|nr:MULTISPECIES: hypothetical protein [unclassified Ruminococcus]